MARPPVHTPVPGPLVVVKVARWGRKAKSTRRIAVAAAYLGLVKSLYANGLVVVVRAGVELETAARCLVYICAPSYGLNGLRQGCKGPLQERSQILPGEDK